MFAVEEVMTKKVSTVGPKDPVVKAIQLMSEKSISCIVVTERKKVKGILTERDVINRVIPRANIINDLTVEEVMTTEVIGISPKDDLDKVANLLKQYHKRHFPVVEHGTLVGIITETDILNGTIKKIKRLNWKLVMGEINIDNYKRTLKAKGLL